MTYNFRIYRNLHKKCWSIQHYVSGKGWRLFEHLDSLEAINCTTKVYEAGRQRVLATKKKNIHAYILCESYTPHGCCVMIEAGVFASYNPYKYSYFYDVKLEVKAPEKFGKATLLPYGEVIAHDL